MNPGDWHILRSMRLLQNLQTGTINNLLAESAAHTLGAGSVLFEQGDEPRFVHFILNGDVALIGRSDEHEAVIEFFRGGEVLLTPAVILIRPYLVSARTVAESRIVQVPAERFRQVADRDHTLTTALNQELARHWRLLVVQMKDLKLRSAPQRLASYLVSRYETPGRPVMINEERRALATRLGMTPESLSRAFRALTEVGVNSRGKAVSIASVEQLREFCRYDELT